MTDSKRKSAATARFLDSQLNTGASVLPPEQPKHKVKSALASLAPSPPMARAPASQRSKWANFYATRFSCDAYRAYVQYRYGPFLDFLEDSIEDYDEVLEVGVGTGVITSIMEERNPLPLYFGIDIDPEMVAEASKMGVDAEEGDMRNLYDLGVPDIIHGMGVLEHLSDADIVTHIVAAKASGAAMLIHYVPGALHVLPSLGDERLMSPIEWQRIAAPTEIILFNDAKDYVLVWRFK